MATLREQVSALAKRIAQEINLVRQEMTNIEVDSTATDISYGNYGYENVGTALDSLLYKAIAINSFTHNAGTKEMGSTVTDVTFTWSTNKTPTTLTLDGKELDVSATTTTLSGLTITSNKTYTLKATDEKEASATKSTTISFLNGVYTGVGAVDASGVDSAFILGLSKALASSKNKTFTANAGANQYIYYAYPARFGSATFFVGGFEGGFDLLATVDFTNASGYTESYYVYRSSNHSLGSTEVTVK